MKKQDNVFLGGRLELINKQSICLKIRKLLIFLTALYTMELEQMALALNMIFTETFQGTSNKSCCILKIKLVGTDKKKPPSKKYNHHQNKKKNF